MYSADTSVQENGKLSLEVGVTLNTTQVMLCTEKVVLGPPGAFSDLIQIKKFDMSMFIFWMPSRENLKLNKTRRPKSIDDYFSCLLQGNIPQTRLFDTQLEPFCPFCLLPSPAYRVQNNSPLNL